MQRQFPHVEADAIELFAADLDADGAAALGEMQREALTADQSMMLPSRGATVFRRQDGGKCVTQERLAEGSALDTIELGVTFEGGEAAPHLGTVLQISGLEALCKDAAVLTPAGDLFGLMMHADPICYRTSEYGMHELRVRTKADDAVLRCRFMVCSPLGEFAEALDHFHDANDWVWDGSWTEELEEATIGMLVAVDEQFESMAPQMLGGSMQSMLEPSRKRLEKYMAKALEEHDVLSLGRAESAIRQLVLMQSCLEMFGPMLRMGMGSATGPLQSSSFYQSVLAFERARYSAASDAKRAEVSATIARIVAAADAHVAAIHGTNAQDFVNRWQGGLRAELELMVQDPRAVHPFPFQQLRGGGGGYISDMMASMAESFGGRSGQTVQRSETTEALSALSPYATVSEAMARIRRWDESLVDDAVQFGSPMQPFKVHGRDPHVRTVMAAMQSVMSLGCGYVAQGEAEDAALGDGSSTRIVVPLDRVKAALPLNSYQAFLRERRRRDRLKDVCRVLRAARRKGQRLSLTVNSDFAGTLKALKEHHADNWISPGLEAVWFKMIDEHQIFAFELWLHDAADKDGKSPPPRLIAADFGHPHTFGKAYYVATRFFDRECRTLQPGFVLAFAEAECLRRSGFELWDLGGADASPMMQYKPQVAIEMSRSEYLLSLHDVRMENEAADMSQRLARPICDEAAPAPSGGAAVPTGVVFDDVDECHLWGSAALKELDASSTKDAAAAAKKGEKALKKGQQRQADKAQKKEAPPAAAASTKKAFSPPSRTETETPSETQKVAAPASAPGGGEPGQPAPAAPQPDAKKDEARIRFQAVFQQLVAEGVSTNEAAVRALQTVAA